MTTIYVLAGRNPFQLNQDFSLVYLDIFTKLHMVISISKPRPPLNVMTKY